MENNFENHIRDINKELGLKLTGINVLRSEHVELLVAVCPDYNRRGVPRSHRLWLCRHRLYLAPSVWR
jgi:hypothetical protein